MAGPDLRMVPGAMLGGGGPPMMPGKEEMAEQRRVAAVQLAIQSLHTSGDGNVYTDDTLIKRAGRIDTFITSGNTGHSDKT